MTAPSEYPYSEFVPGRRLLHAEKPRAVYYHYAADGECLYVGCSANPLRRNGTHSIASEWYQAVTRIEIKWFPHAAAALDFEGQEIDRLKPRYNKRIGRREVHG